MSSLFGDYALSLHRALVGEITPAIRAICLAVSETEVIVTVFHSGPLADSLAEDLDSALAEVYADFPSLGTSQFLHLGFDRRDAPSPVPAIGVPIFATKGTQFLVASAEG